MAGTTIRRHTYPREEPDALTGTSGSVRGAPGNRRSYRDPETRAQRCWAPTANVLDRLPKRVQGEAKSMLHEIWGSATRAHAKEAFERFLATWEAKYPRAAECLAGDREELLAFYDFPAAHWRSLRTTNPIESTFATIRLRTAKTRYCLSEKTALSLVHQLAMSAEKRWRRLRGFSVIRQT